MTSLSFRIASNPYLCPAYIAMVDPKIVSFDDVETAFSGKTNRGLRRAYWLFRMINNNFLVNVGPGMLSIALALRLPVIPIVRKTIFKHFCGGESIADSEKTIRALHQFHIGTLLDYSVEGKHDEADLDHTCHEIIQTILRAKSDDAIPFSVFKISGMSRIKLLEKVSSKEKLSDEEIKEFERVHQRVVDICSAASENNVCIFIDAEESWIQHAIDDLVLEMMKRFNIQKPAVFNTIQMYRHDRLAYLKDILKLARDEKFFVGMKIVRGAYMEKERDRAKELGYPSPIQPDKTSCDRDYDLAVKLCVENIDIVSICAGTHNEQSSRLLMELMLINNIEANDTRIYFSQLLGMSDHISYNLARAGYNVVKYVPYGPVKAVLPYLIRRAQENTSISGQMGRELSLILREMKRRGIKTI